MYLLDTNTLIYFFKNQGQVANHLLSKKPKEIGIPAVVLYELELGIAKSTSPHKRMQQLKQFLSTVQTFAFDAAEAKAAADIRAGLEKRGLPIGPHDVLIAGTAMANKATLVTHDTKEFGRIKGLKIEDWY